MFCTYLSKDNSEENTFKNFPGNREYYCELFNDKKKILHFW